jgi:hypothetical protein
MGIFHWSPLFWLQLYRTGNTYFVYFDVSGTFRNSSEDFYGVNFFTWEATWDEEAREGGTWAQTIPGSAGPSPGRAT